MGDIVHFLHGLPVRGKPGVMGFFVFPPVEDSKIGGLSQANRRGTAGRDGLTFMGAERLRMFHGYVVTAAGFGVWLIGWGAYSTCFGVFVKPLEAEFGWSRAEISMAYSLLFFFQALFGIPMGWLTDRLGPRFLTAVVGSLMGLSYLLLSRVDALWQFIVCYGLLGGLGTSILNVPVMVAVTRWFVARRGLMMGIVQAGAGIGGFFFPPLAGWLIQTHGWRSAYWVLGLFCLLGMVLSGLFLHGDPADVGQSPDGIRDHVPAMEREEDVSIPAKDSLREEFLSRPFFLLTGIFLSFGFCRATFLAHIAPHVQDLGFSLTVGAHLIALISAFSVLGRIGMGRVADRIGNRPALVVSFAATAGILFWGLAAHHLWMLYVFALVFGLAWGSQAVLRFAVTSEAFGLSSLGLLMGVLSFSESMAAMFGSYIAGDIFDRFGTYAPAFWLGIGFALGGVALSGLLKGRRPGSLLNS
ncbi:MAG: MFS transporter [Thermodesulfobacteriota bacterium]